MLKRSCRCVGAATALDSNALQRGCGLVFQFPERHFLGPDMATELCMTQAGQPGWTGMNSLMAEVLAATGLLVRDHETRSDSKQSYITETLRSAANTRVQADELASQPRRSTDVHALLCQRKHDLPCYNSSHSCRVYSSSLPVLRCNFTAQPSRTLAVGYGSRTRSGNAERWLQAAARARGAAAAAA